MLELLPFLACSLALLLVVIAAIRKDRLALVGSGLCLLAIALFWLFVSRRTSELEFALEQARERIALLEALPQKRGFTEDGRAALVQRLSTFVGPTAFVVANSSDLETTEYAREIVTILKDAGWDVPASFGMTYTPILMPGQTEVPSGITLGLSADVPSDFGHSLFVALQEAGIEVRRGPHWPGTEHPISILVGPKPLP